MVRQTIADPTVIVPVPPTRLIGREREVGEVADLLRRDDLRLVTITGTGGVDKTHLALEVGHRVAPRFSDGVVFVSLAAIRDPDLVLPTIANELGIRDFVLTERGVCRLHPQLARTVAGLGVGDAAVQNVAARVGRELAGV